MHHLWNTFNKIKSTISEVLGDNPQLLKDRVRPGPKLRISDLDIIALSLTADYTGVNSENYLFAALNSDYKDSFKKLISRRQYNDRRKRIKDKILLLQELISDKFNKARKTQDIYVIDSAPLKLCKLPRSNWSTICKDHDKLIPKVAFCAAQDENFYGFRLHMICTSEGAIKAFKIESPNHDERQYLYEIGHKFEGCLIVGDKGYLSRERKNYLLENHRIILETPYRKNMKNAKPFLYGRERKRIETLFSQLNDQFQIQRNYAKRIAGYLTRIYSKVCSLTLMSYINKTKGKHIGRVQYALI